MVKFLNPGRYVLAGVFAATVASVVVGAEPVTIDNFAEKETHAMMHGMMQITGGIGEVFHQPVVTPLDRQPVVRSNVDTLYTAVIVDLSSPVTINMPDTDGRYQTLLVVNEGHYAPIVYSEAGEYVLTEEIAGSRYASLIGRTMVNIVNDGDLDKARIAQNAMTFTQADKGNLEDLPVPDMDTLIPIRENLRALGENHTDYIYTYGKNAEDVNMVHHLIGTAIAWGGWAADNATYVQGTPEHNDGETAYSITLNDVPVADDAFWSVTVYNEEGFLSTETGSHVINSQSAVPNGDGSVTVNFTNDTSVENSIEILDGWNYLIRLYKPTPAYFAGEWTVPVATK
ncbi:DUF1214 domain-containing protein [Candidatus Colwellia aromaticivorans]|uniref:DUF1214 domain-containing protein n=1 Tax=Candidatus Colwellia aromaticivorans TaxID=2267621 RepID=UPI000DF1D489|nr:DUF1214 domain-containing protein [Candidatus Colwellia aromaticivorans]